MKNTKKRGFTIVELVIVIAVIAILASVLVPTFANVVTKAKKSAAMQNARSAWTAYLADEAFNGKDLPADETACIEVKTGEGENATTYHFEIKAGVFTGEECHKEDTDIHDKVYEIKNGKIEALTRKTHTAPPAPGGGAGTQDGEGGNTDPTT